MTLGEVKSKLRTYVKHWKERAEDYIGTADEKMEGYAEGKWRAFQRALTLLNKVEEAGTGKGRG